jgi:hypothetical protein
LEIVRHILSYSLRVISSVLILFHVDQAEWDDPPSNTILRIMWKSPESLGMDIYDWATKRGEIIGTVYTFYELLHDDEYSDSGKGILWF